MIRLCALSLIVAAHPAWAQDVPRFAETAAGVDHSFTGEWEFMVGGGVASFDCNGDALPDLALWHYPGERHWHHEMTREQSNLHEIDVYAQQLRHFRAVAERRETPICSALDGWRTLQATQALLQAARTGQRQTCPAFSASRNQT